MHKEEYWDKLIVALDVTNSAQLKKIVSTLTPKVKKYKIGLVAFSRFGPGVIRWINKRGASVFLDFKLYDIPNTMIETAKSFIDLNVWAYTVHARAGENTLATVHEAIAKAARVKKKQAPMMVGVTELTSEAASLKSVLRYAQTAKDAGLHAVVSSVWEAKKIKQDLGLVTITPGIRAKKTNDDQKRVATFQDVLLNEVDYCVVGRPIVEAKNYLKAAEDLLGI